MSTFFGIPLFTYKSLDPTNDFKIKEGPSLNYARQNHACGKMKVNGKTMLVVAGGIHWQKYLDEEDYSVHFTEILDPTSDKGWILGKQHGF